HGGGSLPSTRGAQSVRCLWHFPHRYYGTYEGRHSLAADDVGVPGHRHVLAMVDAGAATIARHDVEIPTPSMGSGSCERGSALIYSKGHSKGTPRALQGPTSPGTGVPGLVNSAKVRKARPGSVADRSARGWSCRPTGGCTSCRLPALPCLWRSHTSP